MSSPEVNPVLQCILTGDTEGLQQCFENPEDPNHEIASQQLQEQDIVGRSNLFMACMLGRSDILQELVKYGADINEVTSRGYSPLHSVAVWGHSETLRTLVELGADIQARNFQDERPKDVALRYMQTECVDILDWAEAKQALQMYISYIQGIITDPEKVQGRLNKEDRNTTMNLCHLKSDWLLNTKNPSIKDFIEQKSQLENTLQPILSKLNTPPSGSLKNTKLRVSGSSRGSP
ncbi:ankyrin repeat domain-containing protein 45 [Latimeria chalumnae]|uniref:Ankyrin repeat domain 45 n=1 Tax=Latimeria chalumnae TaxID=7897 RepID=H3AXW2_LATCH|nr:PREDICTED: ankyrin repeat domain-containing protein 45 [Latimeria chalumnae]|eukprot:XP_005996898.1 PREDICTED: ankyrin repeat domain-containing protein 45 [Latimeria chalumnae]